MIEGSVPGQQLMDPDLAPGGPKTYRTAGTGILRIHNTEKNNMIKEIFNWKYHIPVPVVKFVVKYKYIFITKEKKSFKSLDEGAHNFN